MSTRGDRVKISQERGQLSKIKEKKLERHYDDSWKGLMGIT